MAVTAPWLMYLTTKVSCVSVEKSCSDCGLLLTAAPSNFSIGNGSTEVEVFNNSAIIVRIRDINVSNIYYSGISILKFK